MNTVTVTGRQLLFHERNVLNDLMHTFMYDDGFIHMSTVFPSDAVRKRTSLSLFFCIFLMEEAYSTSMSVLKLANSSLRFLRSKNTAQMEQAEYLNTCS